MFFYKSSLDRIVSLSDVKYKGNLIASQLEEFVINIANVFGPLTVMSLRLVDPFLKELFETSLTGVDRELGL